MSFRNTNDGNKNQEQETGTKEPLVNGIEAHSSLTSLLLEAENGKAVIWTADNKNEIVQLLTEKGMIDKPSTNNVESFQMFEDSGTLPDESTMTSTPDLFKKDSEQGKVVDRELRSGLSMSFFLLLLT